MRSGIRLSLPAERIGDLIVTDRNVNERRQSVFILVFEGHGDRPDAGRFGPATFGLVKPTPTNDFSIDLQQNKKVIAFPGYDRVDFEFA